MKYRTAAAASVTAPAPSVAPITAYSYVRFSTPEQSKGDSLRRQTDLAAAYCTRKGWRLSEQSYRDLGVSAYKGDNLLIGRLGEFLKAVRSGAVAPGSALVVESIDRISRQGIDEGYDTIKALLKTGVMLVTLSPEREFDASATQSLSKGALEIQLILERAAEESARKAARLGGVWEEKRKQARAGGPPITRVRPAWIDMRDGKFVPLPEREAAVRRIFRLAADGLGSKRIAASLVREEMPPLGPSGHWNASTVSALMRDRRALGDFQPRRRDGSVAGPPITGYFPAAVTEAEWLAARAGAEQRRLASRPGTSARPWTAGEDEIVRANEPKVAVRLLAGRTRTQVDRRRKHLKLPPEGKRGAAVARQHINIFAGLVSGATPDRGYYSRESHPSGNRVLVNTAGVEGRERFVSFPEATFEAAVLSCLRELDPRDVLPAADAEPDPVQVLTGELAQVEVRIGQVETLMETGSAAAESYSRVLEKLHERRRELSARLADARVKAARPAADAFTEFGTLLDVLAKAADPTAARLRLRSVLRRMVAEVRLLIVPRGAVRLAAVTVAFYGGAIRNYLIFHRPPWGCGKRPTTPGRWAVRSAGTADPLGLFLMRFDLRQKELTVDPPHPDDAGQTTATDGWEDVEAFLKAYPADLLDRLLTDGTPVPAARR